MRTPKKPHLNLVDLDSSIATATLESPEAVKNEILKLLEAKSPNTRDAYMRAFMASSSGWYFFCQRKGLNWRHYKIDIVCEWFQELHNLHKISANTLDLKLAALRIITQRVEGGYVESDPHQKVRDCIRIMRNDEKKKRIVANRSRQEKGNEAAKKTRTIKPMRMETICALLLHPEVALLTKTQIALATCAGGLRISELLSLHWEDFLDDTELDTGLEWNLPTTKNGREHVVGVSKIVSSDPEVLKLCPVRLFLAYRQEFMRERGINNIEDLTGRVFPTGRDPNKINRSVPHYQLKKALKLIGETPELYSWHSLRAGFITEAISENVSLVEIAKACNHKSISTTMGYIKLAPRENRARVSYQEKLTRQVSK